MSRRFAIRQSRADLSEPAIVEALEKAGWEVHKNLPVDLLCLKRISPELVLIRLLDAKTPVTKAGAPRKRKDQPKQDAFCERWDIKKPTNAFEALLAVGETVKV